MNERFRLLAEQAISFRLDPDSKCYEALIHPEDLELFAELIVKECSKVIVNGGYRNPALGEKHPLTPPEIATMIKEHFGVEE